MYMVKEVGDDFSDGYVVDIQFISFNEKKQEVERTFKLV